MSSSIYEDPDLMMNVRSSTAEDRGESLEGLDSLYENIDANTGRPVHLSTQDGELHNENLLTGVQRNPFRVIGLILVLLLLVGLTVLYRHHMTVVWKEKQLNFEYLKLMSEMEKITCKFGKENQIWGNTTEWKRFQCSCYYISTERKNWTESRKDCKKNGADLVVLKTKIKHDFFKEMNKLGEFWIGLERKDISKDWKKEWDWKWVDGTPPTFTTWNKDMNLNPDGDFKAYMDVDGTWIHTNSGSKHWICERDMYREFPGDLSV